MNQALVGSSHKSDRLQNEAPHNPTQFYTGPGELLAEHMNFFSNPRLTCTLTFQTCVLSLVPFIHIHTQTFV